MKIDQSALDDLRQRLRSESNALWRGFRVQHMIGGDAEIWLLIKPDDLNRAYLKSLEILSKTFEIYRETEFYLSFYFREADEELLSAYLTDDELRTGNLDFALGEETGDLRRPFDADFWEPTI